MGYVKFHSGVGRAAGILRDTDAFIEKTVLSLLKRHGLRSICDYGCGGGDLLRRIDAATGGRLRLAGVDYFSKGRRWRKEWALPPASASGNLTFVDRGSPGFRKLAGGKGGFDLVTSFCALHHFQYPCAELRTIRSLAGPGGLVLLADWAFEGGRSGSAKDVFSFLSESFHAFAGKYHRHHYTPEQAEDLLLATDLRIIRTETVRFRNPGRVRERSRDNALHSLGHMRMANGKTKDRIARGYFEREFDLVEPLVKKHGIDYPSMFLITARRSARHED